ncbi:MAG: hypothetical protein IPO16_00040 [Saprospiraceae bacterium]|nr:hypothetical protein [Saprospiraceae bacterium]
MQEGVTVTSSDLVSEWEKTLAFFDHLISIGHKLRPIRFLTRHIIDKGYNSLLYPGTSLYNLLVSVPTNNETNYDQTLLIECDQLKNIVKFKYRDYTGIDRQKEGSLENALKWSETCQPTEVNDTFEFFLKEFHFGQQKKDIV